ncbi:MAG TPA: YceI family protein [Chloroflexota bacterium]|nr:YceI family protein [Chloroflexota bacterium]
MSTHVQRRYALASACLLLAVACSPAAPNAGPASSAPASQATAGATRAASGTAPAGAGATATAPAQSGAPAAGVVRFQVVPTESTATFRVREQLVGVELPNDAVGTTGAVTGQLAVRPDGSFVTDASRVTVDLRQLRTDESRRDNFIKSNTLATARFPTAEFVPSRASGLPSPLPASGEYQFKLDGSMTIRGVEKPVTWDVTARREGNSLTGTATTSFAFGDFGMTPPRVPVVLSVTDEIRLEVNLVATQA